MLPRRNSIVMSELRNSNVKVVERRNSKIESPRRISKTEDKEPSEITLKNGVSNNHASQINSNGVKGRSGSTENVLNIKKNGDRSSLKSLRSQSDDDISQMEDDEIRDEITVEKTEDNDPRKYSDANIRNKLLKQKVHQDNIRNIQQSRGNRDTLDSKETAQDVVVVNSIEKIVIVSATSLGVKKKNFWRTGVVRNMNIFIFAYIRRIFKHMYVYIYKCMYESINIFLYKYIKTCV